MTTNSVYMEEIVSELMRLDLNAVEDIQRSDPNGVALPKLAITEEAISKLAECWNQNVVRPDRGLYRPYIEQTIYRYAQNRQGWKKKFGLD